MNQSIDTEGIVSLLLQPIETDDLYLVIVGTTDIEGLSSVDTGGILSEPVQSTGTPQSMVMCRLVSGIFLTIGIQGPASVIGPSGLRAPPVVSDGSIVVCIFVLLKRSKNQPVDVLRIMNCLASVLQRK